MRRRALATLASTPTRSNSIVDGLRLLICTRSDALNSSRSQWCDSPGWCPGKAVPEICERRRQVSVGRLGWSALAHVFDALLAKPDEPASLDLFCAGHVA